MKTWINLFSVFAVINCGLGLHLPTNFKVCHRSAQDYNECLATAIEDALPKLENGLKEFKFPSIQPIKVPSLTIGEGVGAVHVVQKYNNVEIFNVPKAKITGTKLTLTDTEFNLHVDAYFDELRLEADYDFDGQILVLPLVGNGKCTVTLQNVTASADLHGSVFEKKDKRYVDITEFVLKFDPQHGIFDFRNLFNGDERLANETLSVLNEQWKEVFNDIKPGYEEALSLILKNLANLFIKKVPIDEAFPL